MCVNKVGFKVLSAVIMNSTFLKVITSCVSGKTKHYEEHASIIRIEKQAKQDQPIESGKKSEDGGDKFSRNVGWLLLKREENLKLLEY
jgi:hypothetical protein